LLLARPRGVDAGSGIGFSSVDCEYMSPLHRDYDAPRKAAVAAFRDESLDCRPLEPPRPKVLSRPAMLKLCL